MSLSPEILEGLQKDLEASPAARDWKLLDDYTDLSTRQVKVVIDKIEETQVVIPSIDLNRAATAIILTAITGDRTQHLLLVKIKTGSEIFNEADSLACRYTLAKTWLACDQLVKEFGHLLPSVCQKEFQRIFAAHEQPTTEIVKGIQTDPRKIHQLADNLLIELNEKTLQSAGLTKKQLQSDYEYAMRLAYP